uniref:ARAD1D45650p n=1 Tax=Blastobotrys adeninivorans TaxID=409370 RepID=A0A060TCT6_BLAAD
MSHSHGPVEDNSLTRSNIAMKYLIRAAVLVLLMVRAKSHKSLSDGGILAAIATGIVHSAPLSSLFLVLLVVFYLTGSRFTKYKLEVKQSLTAHETDGGAKQQDKSQPTETRNYIQVLANSLFASLAIVGYLVTGQKHDLFLVGVVANYAAVTADTWSSELGILSSKPPVLITTLKPCPKGTNGGVSQLGLTVAALGGVVIGAISGSWVYFNLDWSAKRSLGLFVMTSFLGLYGSIVDSVLGAVLQQSVVNKQGKVVEAAGGGKLNKIEGKVCNGMDILSNNQVNLLMAGITTGVGMALWHLLAA